MKNIWKPATNYKRIIKLYWDIFIAWYLKIYIYISGILDIITYY